MTNSKSNVLNWAYTGHKVLKNLGAPVEIVDSAGDRDQKIALPDSQVAHYALPLSPSRLILTNLIVNSEQPGFDLLKMGVADHFIPGSFSAKIAINTSLSIPSTISSTTNVAKPTHADGSDIHSKIIDVTPLQNQQYRYEVEILKGRHK